jgi:hypothetical protein
VIIDLKDQPVAPLENNTGYPPAFPYPHVKKVLENDRVIIWSYRLNPVEARPGIFTIRTSSWYIRSPLR